MSESLRFGYLEEIELSDVEGGNSFSKFGKAPYFFIGRDPSDADRVIIKTVLGGTIRGSKDWIQKKGA